MIKPDYHHKAKIALFIIKTNSYHNNVILSTSINKCATKILKIENNKTSIYWGEMRTFT